MHEQPEGPVVWFDAPVVSAVTVVCGAARSMTPAVARVSFDGTVPHRPATHDWPAAQARPQAAQFALLVWRLAHTSAAPAPQAVWPVGHAHAPATHDCAAGHATPQPPQLALSLVVFTQEVPQALWPVGQAHAPPRQVCAAPHALPQRPQWALVAIVSTHAAAMPDPQAVWPVGHTQLPPVQLCPVTHARPQAPQLAMSLVTSAQVSEAPAPQAVRPAAQAHAPAWQVWLAGHALPHIPQLAVLLAVSTQAPPQSVWPVGHAQAPATHDWPIGHARPQPPQWRSSAWTSMQVPLQSVRPMRQAHAPATHERPIGHALPQVPQLLVSVCRSMHAPPQAAVPVRHWHTPATQAWPAMHAVPQAPQLAVSVCVSRHAPPQAIWPIGHAHAPATHIWPDGHTLPQRPQFIGSPTTATQALPHSTWPIGQAGGASSTSGETSGAASSAASSAASGAASSATSGARSGVTSWEGGWSSGASGFASGATSGVASGCDGVGVTPSLHAATPAATSNDNHNRVRMIVFLARSTRQERPTMRRPDRAFPSGARYRESSCAHKPVSDDCEVQTSCSFDTFIRPSQKDGCSLRGGACAEVATVVSLSALMKSPLRRPEVLAPAGDGLSLRAAVRAGADAVYFGLQGFNARARATNFDAATLGDTMRLLHEHGVRGYVTLNTLVFDHELDAVEAAVRACAAAGVDAVIVQDLGVARVVRAVAPTLPIHASTQMTCTDAGSVELARDLGASRVILARELSLDDLRDLRARTDVELEVFVHGALCVAYSGQCLTSEAIGGRSANRGACAQACRLPYELVVDGERRDTGDRAYLLSPEDQETSAVVPELVALATVREALARVGFVEPCLLEALAEGERIVPAPTLADLRAIEARLLKPTFPKGIAHWEEEVEDDPVGARVRRAACSRYMAVSWALAADPPAALPYALGAIGDRDRAAPVGEAYDARVLAALFGESRAT